MAVNQNLTRTAEGYNTIEFGGVNLGAEDYGYVVQASPNYEYAEHETENIRIPGKNGDIIHYTGAYLNTTRQYSLVKLLENNNDYRDHREFVTEAQKIVGKLKSKTGYQILQDTFEPDYYRYAVLKNAGVVVNGGDQAVSITLEFECKPQRWLVSGDTPVKPDPEAEVQSVNLKNDTDFDALPLIIVTKAENENATTLTVTGNDPITIDWTKTTNTRIVIDSELMDCYSTNDDLNMEFNFSDMSTADTSLNSTNMNACVGFISEFPKLKANIQNTVSVDNGTVSVKPRWWTL